MSAKCTSKPLREGSFRQHARRPPGVPSNEHPVSEGVAMNRSLGRHAFPYRRKSILFLIATSFGVAAMAGCGANSPNFGLRRSAQADATAAATVVPRSAHLIVVMEENTGYSS